jgi:hypothetical protein
MKIDISVTARDIAEGICNDLFTSAQESISKWVDTMSDAVSLRFDHQRSAIATAEIVPL